MEYVSDGEQIVEENEHDEDDKSEDKEYGEPEVEGDEEPEVGKDEEKNLWVGIQEDNEERHKKKIEILITEFQKSGESEEVTPVEPASSLQRRPERCVVGRAEMDMCLEKGPHLSRSSANQR